MASSLQVKMTRRVWLGAETEYFLQEILEKNVIDLDSQQTNKQMHKKK